MQNLNPSFSFWVQGLHNSHTFSLFTLEKQGLHCQRARRDYSSISKWLPRGVQHSAPVWQGVLPDVSLSHFVEIWLGKAHLAIALAGVVIAEQPLPAAEVQIKFNQTHSLAVVCVVCAVSSETSSLVTVLPRPAENPYHASQPPKHPDSLNQDLYIKRAHSCRTLCCMTCWSSLYSYHFTE